MLLRRSESVRLALTLAKKKESLENRKAFTCEQKEGELETGGSVDLAERIKCSIVSHSPKRGVFADSAGSAEQGCTSRWSETCPTNVGSPWLTADELRPLWDSRFECRKGCFWSFRVREARGEAQDKSAKFL